MKFETPKIDPKKALGSLDGLANKIPEDVANLLKKIAVVLFVFFALIAAYYGWTLGYGGSAPEGLKLAEDTKSIFKEDIEREYNRKRKNIRLSDIELDITERAEERMLREDLRRKEGNQPPNRLLDPDSQLPEDREDLYRQRRTDSLPGVLSPQDRMELERGSSNSSPSPSQESIPGRDESENKNLDREDKLKRLENLEKELESSENATRRLEKTIERLERLEKRKLVKPVVDP